MRARWASGALNTPTLYPEALVKEVTPANLATFEKKLYFWGAIWAPMAPKHDMI